MTGTDRALHDLRVAEAVELLGIAALINHVHALDRKVTRIMTALEDLQAVDTELAAAVTELAGAVDRIDADFVALQQAVAAGDPAAIEAEVAKLRATVDAAKAAKANIDTTDPTP